MDTGEDYCVTLHQHGRHNVQRICRDWRSSPADDLQRPPVQAVSELGRRASALEELVVAQHVGDSKNSIHELRLHTDGMLRVRPMDSASIYHPISLAQIPSLCPRTWEVFGSNGRLERRMALPSRLRPLWFDRDAAWGAVDESDGSVSIGCVGLAPSSRCAN